MRKALKRYQDNKRHREDEPAISKFVIYEPVRISPPVTRHWYLDGKHYTKEEYEVEMRLRKWGLSVDRSA